MFFVNKNDREEIVELIYSGTGFCIVIDQIQTLENADKNPVGKIVKYGKKELKRHFKKIKPQHKTVLMSPITEEVKNHIIEAFDVDKIGLLQYTEDYVERKKYLERQEEIEKQSEADRARMMKILADDYNPNGIKIKDQ